MWKCLIWTRRMGRRWELRRGLLRTRTMYECIIHCIQLVCTKLRRLNSRLNFVSVFYAYKFLFLSNILKSIRKQIRIKIKHILAHLNHSDKAPITHIISIDLRSGITNTSNCYRTFHYILFVGSSKKSVWFRIKWLGFGLLLVFHVEICATH